MSDEAKKLLNLSRRHTLRHYIRLVGGLYGETPAVLDGYVEDQVKVAGENLEAPIACFESMIDKKAYKKILEDLKPKKFVKWKQLTRKGSRLCPIPPKTDQISTEQEDSGLPDKTGR